MTYRATLLTASLEILVEASFASMEQATSWADACFHTEPLAQHVHIDKIEEEACDPATK